MKVLRSPALVLAIVALCLGLPARADIAKDARAYCNTEYGGGSKNVERCVRRQLRAAESVGEQLAREAANPEAQRIYERCAAESIARVGIHDWSRTETCLINELRPYHRFMRAKEAGRDDKFIRSDNSFSPDSKVLRAQSGIRESAIDNPIGEKPPGRFSVAPP